MASVRDLTLWATAAVIAISAPASAQTSAAAAPPKVEPYDVSVDPFYRDINAFWGNINPFYGNIDPFWGDINPFYRDINAFWGDINPFYRDINAFTGEAPPDYGKVGTFWRDFGLYWTDADKEWSAVGSYPNDLGNYERLQLTLNDLVARSEATWGAAVTARTGQSFRDGFASAVFAKHGVDLADPATFQGLDAAKRARLFLDWYDGLMDYAGTDRVDYWMGTVNWSPRLTQIQGGGRGTVIGLIDSSVVNNADIANNLIYAGGHSNPLNGHGTGVASLLVSAHDGKGLMGFAPHAKLAAHNPFDGTGTASWNDVVNGVIALKARDAGVINLSMGVAGWSLHKDWGQVFNHPLVAAARHDTVYVIAAGNDGKQQTANIDWNFANDPALILVGSVNPSGQISSFSNTPEKACLLRNGNCYEDNRLWNRFIVAPGEAVLVADGQGGTIRRSGTSFAAPQVTGAIALLHDRWPWLTNYPRETVDIILKSAKDLGSSGVDPVYGWGLLDVEASQSPLSFNNLTYYEVRHGSITQRTASSIRSRGVKSTWEADGVFYAMFETIGRTRRDFIVPLSSRLIGQQVGVGSYLETFQSYLTSRFTDWIRTGKVAGFASLDSVEVPNRDGWAMTLTGNSPANYLNRGHGITGGHTAMTLSNDRQGVKLTAGFGQGALAFNGKTGFALASDHHSAGGGVNPLLGFASGGAFAAVDIEVAPRLTFSSGVTQHHLRHSDLPGLKAADRDALRGLKPYQASAVNVAIAYDFGDDAALTASYTRLDEADGLLGVQSIEDGDLRHGSVSDALTLGAHATVARGLQVSASATAARTKAENADQAFTTAGNGALSSSFAVAVAQSGVIGTNDTLRLSLAQPLHIEKGTMAFTSIAVIDRATGEIGPVTSTFEIGGGKRRLTGEALYAVPLLDGNGELSLFGRAELRQGADANAEGLIVGGRLHLRF